VSDLKMQQTVIHNLLYNCSLLSSQEIKIDADNNLQISTFNISKTVKNTIPLDLINPQPKITEHPNIHLLKLAFLSFITSIVFFLLSSEINYPIGQMISGIFALFCILFIIVSFTKKSVAYTFFYARTTTHLFTLHESQSNNKLVETFVNQLTQQIKGSKDTSTKGDKQTEYTSHLDFLYNHGVINDVFYERINHRIYEKVNDIKPKRLLADVVTLPIRKA
jgi:hypothetical protein